MKIDVQTEEVNHLEESLANIKISENEEHQASNASMKDGGSNGFVIELLICSIILWSFLFSMQYGFEQKILLKVDEILSSKTSLSLLSDIEDQVEDMVYHLFFMNEEVGGKND